MKNQKTIILMYLSLIDYILISSNLSKYIKSIEHTIIKDDFIETFKMVVLDIINKNVSYPSNIKENLNEYNTLLKKYDKNIDDIIDLLNEYDSYSNDKYVSEYDVRVNSLLLAQKNPFIVWKKEEIEEELLFDYVTLTALSVDENTFQKNYYSNLILKKDFLLSLNKLLYTTPEIFVNKNIKERTLYILNKNNELLNMYNMSTFGEFIKRNYNVDDLTEVYLDTEELDIFKEMNNNIILSLNNLKLIPFSLNELSDYHDYLNIEHYLYCGETNIDNIKITSIFKYIDSISNISESNRKKLINLLNNNRYLFKGNNISKYNSYLVKLNSVSTKDFNPNYAEIITKTNFKDRTKISFDKNFEDDSYYNKIVESKKYDLFNFECLLLNSDKFEEIKPLLEHTSFNLSVRKFLKECPNMFMNSIINKRTNELLISYCDDKYTYKQFNKIKKV